VAEWNTLHNSEAGTWRQRLETFILVTVITGLIWVYAEGRVVRPYTHQLRVQFVAPQGQELVIEPVHDGGTDGAVQVSVQVRASQSQIQQLQRTFAGRVLRIPVDDPSAAGEQQRINLRQRLARSAIGDIGATIEDTEPSAVPVRVERLETLTLPIRVQTPPGLELAGPPKVEPLEVGVKMPASDTWRLRNAHIVAPVSESQLEHLQPGASYTFEVGLQLPNWVDRRQISHLNYEPSTAEVTVSLESRTASVTLTDVPIHLSAPWEVLRRHHVELPADRTTLDQLELSGPADIIEQIRAGEEPVWAEVQLSQDQLQAGVEQAPLRVRAPAEVEVLSEPGPVQLRIEPRSPEEP
jgi:hypothetical protein